MFYKEYDSNSYRMRYSRCWVVFRKANDDKEFLAYVAEVDEDGWSLSIPQPGKGNGRDMSARFAFGDIEPKYHYVAPGFYHGLRSEESVAYVRRKLTTTLHVGFGNHFHWQFFDRGRGDTPNILMPVKPNIPKTLKEGTGALSKTLFLWKNNLYYLTQVVGLKSGKNFVVDPIFKSEIDDCLRGHECTVKL